MKNTKGQNILLIGDNTGDIRLIKEMLPEITSINYSLISAETLKEGCEQIKNNDLILILLDLNLPDSAGKQAFDTVIKYAKGIPIVLVSGLQDEELSLSLIKEGAQDYIVKNDLNSRLLEKTIQYAIIHKQAEEVIMLEKDHYIDLVKSMPSGVYRVRVFSPETWKKNAWKSSENAPYLMEFISDRYCEILGVSKETITKNPGILNDLIHPEEKVVFAKSNEDANFSLRKFHWEGRIVNNGNIRWVSLESLPRVLEKGDVIWTGSIQDITERKQEEEKTQLLAHTIKSITEIITITDLEDKFTFVNKAFTDKYGYTYEEIIGKHIKVLVSPNNTRNILEDISKQSRKDSWKGEVLNVTKDGTEFPISLQTSKIINETGDIVGLVGIGKDITERKMAEAALFDIKRELSTLMDNLPGMAYSCLNDKDWTMQFVNKGAYELTGYLQEELIENKALSYNDIIHPEDQKMVWENIQTSIGNKTAYTLEYRIITKNGETKNVWERGQCIYTKDGELHHLEGFISDVTERKKAEEEIKIKNEELLKLNVEKDKFFSIIAHDLRSPFQGFLGFTELLKTSIHTFTIGELQEIANKLNSNANKLFGLLTNLLEWSMMQRGLILFKPEKLSLKNLTKENIILYSETAKTKEIEIKEDINEDVYINADKAMIETVLRNLVSNAIKFTNKKGMVTVSVSMYEKHVLVTVKDTGIGMSNELINDLFRIDRKTNRIGTDKEPSTGLGLFLCKEYVDKHCGKIWVMSEEGKGSEFIVSLPID